jgi:hypothetical protein
MLVPIAPLMALAASLQESAFNYLDYPNASDLCNWTFWL